MQTLQTQPTVKSLFNFKEACNYLDLSPSYLYKLTHKKQIPHYKMPTGKRLVFSKQELDKWLLSKPVKTESDIDQEAADYVVGKR